MRRKERNTGRRDEQRVTGNANPGLMQIERLIREIPQLAPHYVIDTAPDAISICVEISPAWSTACVEERAGYAEALRQSVRAHLDLDATVQVTEAGALERSMDKTSRRRIGRRAGPD